MNIPYSVCGRWGNVDSQSSPTLLHLHCEQQGGVGYLFHFLLNELCLCGLLEIFGLGYLVHQAHDLAGSVASYIAARPKDGKRRGGGGHKE